MGFAFSEKTVVSLTKWIVSKGGGHVLEMAVVFGCLSFPHNVSVA